MTYLEPPRNSLALAAVILGAVASGVGLAWGVLAPFFTPMTVLGVWVVTLVPGLLAIIFGFIGISTANRLQGRRRALAVWGVVLGFLPVAMLVIGHFLRVVVVGV